MLPEWARLVLAALTCYRLAQLVAIDDGPADAFLRLRAWAGAYDIGQDSRPERGLGRLLGCPYCLGVWFALPCAAAALWPTWAGDAALLVLGIAGAQSVLQGRRDV